MHQSKFLQVKKAKRQAGLPAGTKSFLTSLTSLGFNRVTGSEQDVMRKVLSSSGRILCPPPRHQHPKRPPQYSSLMFKGREDGDTSPLLPLLLVTIATLLPLFPWRPPPALPLVTAGGVGVVVEEAGCWSFFLLILRSLARRFWNQIFTWSRRKGSFIHTKIR